MVRDLLISTSYFLHLWLFQCPRKRKQRLCKSELLLFHVEQVFPQCRGLISDLGTPQIASTDRYWVYPSAFSNRALNHPMVKCARKKLKQEPDRSTNQISEKRSPFSLGLKAYTNQRSEKKFRQDWKHQVRKKRASVVCKCGFQACLPVALSLETGGA